MNGTRSQGPTRSVRPRTKVPAVLRPSCCVHLTQNQDETKRSLGPPVLLKVALSAGNFKGKLLHS
jgi:hypothetical protein